MGCGIGKQAEGLIDQNFGCCCHPAVTPTSAVSLKSAEALNYMVSQGRFERPTFPLGGGCSIQLSYWDKCQMLTRKG